MSSQATDWPQESQNASSGTDSRMCNALIDASIDATTAQTTPSETTGCLQNSLKAEFELIATYLANVWVLEQCCTAFDKIYNAAKNSAELQAD